MGSLFFPPNRGVPVWISVNTHHCVLQRSFLVAWKGGIGNDAQVRTKLVSGHLG